MELKQLKCAVGWLRIQGNKNNKLTVRIESVVQTNVKTFILSCRQVHIWFYRTFDKPSPIWCNYNRCTPSTRLLLSGCGLLNKWRETVWRLQVIFPPRTRHRTKVLRTRPGDSHLLMTTCITAYTDTTSHNSSILRHLKHKWKEAKLKEKGKRNPQVSQKLTQKVDSLSKQSWVLVHKSTTLINNMFVALF